MSSKSLVAKRSLLPSRALFLLLAVGLAVSACAGSEETTAESTPGESPAPASAESSDAPPLSDAESPDEHPESTLQPDGSEGFGPAPEVPDGPLDASVIEDLDVIFTDLRSGFDFEAVRRLGESGDPRIAWLISDLLRFIQRGEAEEVLRSTYTDLTGANITGLNAWQPVTDRLIAWDIPAPPDYVRWKRIPFEIIEPSWAPFFDDQDATTDFRYLSWGGVLIDDRPISITHVSCPDGCIPAMTEPPFTDAAGGDWYDDEAIVFGIVVNGEARAYPKNQMEVHEMVNDVLGGRRIGVPYCTLCGSAQAYFTDELDDIEGLDLGVDAGRFELRTSGLLSRSNKVMFELQTFSVFNTFTGEAVSGPLREAGVFLNQVTVETARWGDWKAKYPETTIIEEFGVIGGAYPVDPLRGRDDNGPIFPIGDVDERLETQALVLGITLDDGTTIAFDVDAANAALDAGETVELAGVRVQRDGGLVAELFDGTELVTHQAFWFAWSQFNNNTLLWPDAAS